MNRELPKHMTDLFKLQCFRLFGDEEAKVLFHIFRLYYWKTKLSQLRLVMELRMRRARRIVSTDQGNLWQSLR